MFEIEFSEGALEDLARVRPFEPRRILGAMEAQLGDLPTSESKNRKQLRGLVPPFDAVPPIWELRVGNYRVFYDVDDEEQRVYVRANSAKATS
ncbi:MAG TPA: type II toxin-antitoxin system RelE/ParE family toxin [bacterium]|nr:type II toxin-antitoxin system RelE/ParE family toxin [bacterium]